MLTMLLATALCTTLEPSAAASEPARSPGVEAGATPAPSRTASPGDSVVAAAFGSALEAMAVPDDGTASPFHSASLAVPALAVLGLAGLAFALRRRRRGSAGAIRVVEAVGLGPRRTLVIADVLGDRLVLGVSEAGIAVLSSRPAPHTAAAHEALGEDAPSPSVRGAAAARAGLMTRLFHRPRGPSFDAVFTESLEDQELRAKLAQGLRSDVP